MIPRNDHLEKIYGDTGWVATLRSELTQTSRNVSIVVSEAIYNVGKDVEYSGNAFATYGIASMQNVEEDGLCGRTLPLVDLAWDIEYETLEDLDTAGVVALIDRRGRVSIWKDRTLSTSFTDPGQYLTNMRIVQDLVNDIYKGLKKYIGGPFPQPSVVESVVTDSINARSGFMSASWDINFFRNRGFFTIDLGVEFFGFIHAITVKIEIKV